MNKFTVIGYYENGQRYCDHLFGETWIDAVQAAIHGAGHSLNIVEVFAGWHTGLTESEYVEAACDFPSGEADES